MSESMDTSGIFVSLVVPFTGACRDHLKKYVEERDYQEKLFLNIEVPVVSQPTEEPLAKKRRPDVTDKLIMFPEIEKTYKVTAVHGKLCDIYLSVLSRARKTALENRDDFRKQAEVEPSDNDPENDVEDVSGPGLTGLTNSDNWCYSNSVLQTFTLVPEFNDVYVRGNPSDSLNSRIAKILTDLQSGVSPSAATLDRYRIEAGRNIDGSLHELFSGKEQQDAHEYYIHLLNRIDSSIEGDCNPVNAFRFKLVQKLEGLETHELTYKVMEELVLGVTVPEDLPEEVGDRSSVTLEDCIGREMASVEVDYEGKNSRKTVRFATFPDYLIVHMNRFRPNPMDARKYLKLEVNITLPANGLLDLRKYELPTEDADEMAARQTAAATDAPMALADAAEAATLPQIDSDLVDWLLEEGFPEIAAKKAAVYARGKEGEQAKYAAIYWLQEHMADPDVDIEPSMTSLGQQESRAAGPVNLARKEAKNGPGQYEVCACIVHLGKLPTKGHYIAYLKNDDGWYKFNDARVTVAPNPPLEKGYIYIFKRS